MNNRKYTGGLKATERDLEYLSYIQNLMGVSRAEAIRIAIKKKCMIIRKKIVIEKKFISFMATI